MYNLTLHIEYLLLRHDCVVLPGVGAFINVRHASSLDAATGIWHPMTREVRFNSALSHDDGLLANSYARKHQTGYSEGRDMLRRDIARLQEILETDGEATMGQLGILRKENGHICFHPRQTASQITAALGYMPASMTLEREKTASNKETAEIPATSGIQHQPEHKTIHNGRVFDTSRNYYIAVNKIFARAAACFIVVAVVVLSIMIPTTDNSRMDQASVVPVDKIIRESLAKAERPALEHITDTDTLSRQKNDINSRQKAIEEGSYHAIVATFRSQKEAEEFIGQNSSSGYELSIVPTATRVRVSALRSDNKEELQQLMSTDDFKSKFRNSWIWSEEN